MATPIILLSLLPVISLFRNTDRSLMRQPILLLLLAGGLGFSPALFMIGTTERYLMDLWPSAAILSAVGVWQAAALARTRALRWVLGALIAWGMVLALLLGFTGYYEHFRNWNPPLHRMLVIEN